MHDYLEHCDMPLCYVYGGDYIVRTMILSGALDRWKVSTCLRG